jgi:hypothetical protein
MIRNPPLAAEFLNGAIGLSPNRTVAWFLRFR